MLPIEGIDAAAAPRARFSGGRAGARRRRPAGLTILELLLSLMITALIGGAVAAMMLSVSMGTSSHRDCRGLMIGHAAVASRFGAVVRSARLVLAAGDDFVVVWVPAVGSGAEPVSSELCRIEHEADTGRLWCLRGASSPPADPSVSYDLATTDFDVTTTFTRPIASPPGDLWATDVKEWTIHVPTVDPRQARFVGYRLALESDDAEETATGAVALRN